MPYGAINGFNDISDYTQTFLLTRNRRQTS